MKLYFTVTLPAAWSCKNTHYEASRPNVLLNYWTLGLQNWLWQYCCGQRKKEDLFPSVWLLLRNAALTIFGRFLMCLCCVRSLPSRSGQQTAKCAPSRCCRCWLHCLSQFRASSERPSSMDHNEKPCGSTKSNRDSIYWNPLYLTGLQALSLIQWMLSMCYPLSFCFPRTHSYPPPSLLNPLLPCLCTCCCEQQDPTVCFCSSRASFPALTTPSLSFMCALLPIPAASGLPVQSHEAFVGVEKSSAKLLMLECLGKLHAVEKANCTSFTVKSTRRSQKSGRSCSPCSVELVPTPCVFPVSLWWTCKAFS